MKRYIAMLFLFIGTSWAANFTTTSVNTTINISIGDCWTQNQTNTTFCNNVTYSNLTVQLNHSPNNYTTVNNVTVLGPLPINGNISLASNSSYTNSVENLTVFCAPQIVQTANISTTISPGTTYQNTTLNITVTASACGGCPSLTCPAPANVTLSCPAIPACPSLPKANIAKTLNYSEVYGNSDLNLTLIAPAAQAVCTNTTVAYFDKVEVAGTLYCVERIGNTTNTSTACTNVTLVNFNNTLANKDLELKSLREWQTKQQELNRDRKTLMSELSWLPIGVIMIIAVLVGLHLGAFDRFMRPPPSSPPTMARG